MEQTKPILCSKCKFRFLPEDTIEVRSGVFWCISCVRAGFQEKIKNEKLAKKSSGKVNRFGQVEIADYARCKICDKFHLKNACVIDEELGFVDYLCLQKKKNKIGVKIKEGRH